MARPGLAVPHRLEWAARQGLAVLHPGWVALPRDSAVAGLQGQVPLDLAQAVVVREAQTKGGAGRHSWSIWAII